MVLPPKYPYVRRYADLSARYSISRYDNSDRKWHTISTGILGIAAAIPLLILIARIVETSLETIRTIYVARGHANLAPVSAS